MGTRASIRFADEYGRVVYIYRGHDGHPENVMPDLTALITAAKNRWSGSEVDCLVTLFLSMTWDWKTERLPRYELTAGVHGDEECFYEVNYVEGKKHAFGYFPGTWEAQAVSGPREV